MTRFEAATQPQLDEIDARRVRLAIAPELLDNHSHGQYGCCVEDLSRADAAALIDELDRWAALTEAAARS